MKDKEFKAKNNDTDFSKPQKTDTVIGRHNAQEDSKTDFNSVRKSRMYHNRQEKPEQNDITETNADISESSVSDTVKNNVENPVYEQNAFDTKEPIPEHSEQPKTENTVNHTHRKQTDIFRDENTFTVPVESKVTDIPKVVPKNEKYNIRDAVQENKQDFDISEKSTDFRFRQPIENTSPKGTPDKKGIKPKNKNRLYQKEHTKADETIQSVSSEQSMEPEPIKFDKTETEENTETIDEDIPPQNDFQFDRTKKYEKQAEKLHQKADKARNKVPHKKKIVRQRFYDEQKEKPKNRLQFENEEKPQSDNRYTFVKNSATFAGNKVLTKAHSKIREVEHDNSSVEAAHKTEQQAERLAAHSMRVQKTLSQKRKNAPYKKAERLQYKAEKAEVKALYEKTLSEHPELEKSQIKKFLQKQRIKKNYQKAKRAEQTAKQTKKTVQNTEKAARQVAAFVWRHKAVFGIIIAFVLLIAWLGSVLSSCSVMGTMGANSLMVSSYFADDEDIYAAEDYYVGLERNLQNRIDNIENEFSGYNEYNYNVAGIGHNPYELTSCLTALYMDFKFNDIRSNLDELFNAQYHLTISETVQTRTDNEGNEYTHKILNVTLTNSGFLPSMNAEQTELYNIYLASKGNRDYLFADDIYSNETVPPSYTIPGEALTDETFRKLIIEAEKYLGYPYVWGGSSPSTSFDCSGFVCWVFKNSGVYPLSRTTAQGIYNQCTPIRASEAKPGDIIFFKGTYNTSEVSHVGIYVGNSMMIHCGNPIQYTSVNTNYWQNHFYAYGRLSN